jgi:transcriptional regulator with XRE-family HTH domain
VKRTVVPFDLRTWRYKMRWTQARAAAELGLSLAAYRAAEYRSDDRHECSKTIALLALVLLFGPGAVTASKG